MIHLVTHLPSSSIPNPAVNPVRKYSTFQRGGSFTPLEKISNGASGAFFLTG